MKRKIYPLIEAKVLSLAEDTISLFYPNLCAACDELLVRNEEVICTKCKVSLPRTYFMIDDYNPVAKQFWGKVNLQMAFAFYYFQKGERIQRLLHRLKYDKRPDVGEVIGKIAGRELVKELEYLPFTGIVPVPLHPHKERIRGYNQAACFGEGLSEGSTIKYYSDLLTRVKHTSTQTKKSRYERHLNMASVFHVSSDIDFSKEHLLLVDDVITTGSTLCACAEVLLEKGAKVSVASIAFAAI